MHLQEQVHLDAFQLAVGDVKEVSAVVIIEIDDCYDPDAGKIILPWVKELLEVLGTYVEISPSGTGVHIVAVGERPPNSYSTLTGKGIFPEGVDAHLYGGGVGGRHPVTFTGVPVGGYDLPLANIQNWLDHEAPLKESADRAASSGLGGRLSEESLEEAREGALERVAEKEGVEIEEVRNKARRARAATDQEILRTLRRVHSGEFEKLWDGRYWEAKLEDKSPSGAHQKLVLMLASATGLDDERMDQLLRQSGLCGDKWDKPNYREETIKKAFGVCDRIYEHRGYKRLQAPMASQVTTVEDDEDYEPKERNAILEDLRGLRLNLPWGYRRGDCGGNGMSACFFYGYLVSTAREQGTVYRDPLTGESGVLTLATNLGAEKWSGLTSGSQVTEGKKLIRDEGLIEIKKEGKGTEPSLYLIKSLKDIPKGIVPYPPDLLLSASQHLDLSFAYRCAREHGDGPTSEDMRYAVSGKSISFKKPFRYSSPLNSYAVHRIKHLRNVRLDPSHPDAGERVSYTYEKNGRKKSVSYSKPHPPLAFSPPYRKPFFWIDAPRFNPPLTRQARYELANIRIEGLKYPKQKFLLEQVGHRHSPGGIASFLGIQEDKVLKTINPFVEMGLVQKFEGEIFGGEEECYRWSDNFEAILHERFAGSKETQVGLSKKKDYVGKRRESYRRDFLPLSPKRVVLKGSASLGEYLAAKREERRKTAVPVKRYEKF